MTIKEGVFIIAYSALNPQKKAHSSTSRASYAVSIASIWGWFRICYIHKHHDDVIKWKHFPRYWLFVGEFTGHRWIPLTKASDTELWNFLWSASEQTIK